MIAQLPQLFLPAFVAGGAQPFLSLGQQSAEILFRNQFVAQPGEKSLEGPAGLDGIAPQFHRLQVRQLPVTLPQQE